MITGPSSSNDNSDNMLKTLDSEGEPPKSRIGDGAQAYSIWIGLWQADATRSKRRTLVKGLVDGNPPYNPDDLAAAGQSYRCNVNWRIAQSYLENASGAFYDLFNEAPTYAVIEINKGNPDEQHKYSQVVTEHFDWLMRNERRFDYNMQVSQNEMTLYATGPMVFADELDWCPRAILSGSLKVPEGTKSDTSYWEEATVEVDYTPSELYGKIVDEKSATAAGWNVEAVKQAIMFAQPLYVQGGVYHQWEWYQQQLKNGALAYNSTSKAICVIHIFWQEFPESGSRAGKISHGIVNRDQAAGGNDKGDSRDFLFKKLNRYDSWDNCIHPMYYDRGGGGFHHSVTGLGVKMYSALTFINRLRCANADKAFAPKIMLEAQGGAADTDEAALEQNGDFLIVKEGYKMAQIPIQSQMEDGIVFDRFVSDDLSGNLSQYRKTSDSGEQKSHVTATKTKYDAANEARLAKTQMVRYYMQLDLLYAEMYHRAVYMGKNKVGFGWERCAEFVRRCEEDGVPRDCLDRKHTEVVRAYRVIGQGSEFLRQQSLEFLMMSVLPMLPEGGRFNMIQDIIASRAGQAAVSRYAPEEENPLPDDQYAGAVNQVANMKVGVPAVATDTQNPAIYSGVYVQAATQSIQSLEQGANPAEVVAFLELCGQALGQQINRMAADPTRKNLVKALTAKLKEIGQVHDKLAQQLAEESQMAQQQQMEAMQAQQQQQGEMALKWQKMQADMAIKGEKAKFQMSEKAKKQRFDMALQDASTAQDLTLSAAETEAKIRNDSLKAAAQARKPKAKAT